MLLSQLHIQPVKMRSILVGAHLDFVLVRGACQTITLVLVNAVQ